MTFRDGAWALGWLLLGCGGAPQTPSTTAGAEPPAQRDEVVEAEVAPALLSDVVELAVADHHSCAVVADGRVACWGRGGRGLLGEPGRTDRPFPVYVAGVQNARRVAVHQRRSCALLADGTAQCWGLAFGGDRGMATSEVATEIPGIAGATELFITSGAVCFIDGAREVHCVSQHELTVPALGDAVALGGAADHLCVLRESGDLLCWPMSGLRREPTLPEARVRDVADFTGNGVHGCAALRDGSVVCWQGQRPAEPVEALSEVRDAVEVGLGFANRCARRRSGSVACWGTGQAMTFGVPERRPTRSSVVHGLTDTRALGMGQYHVCAVRQDRTVVCWGKAEAGQIGADGLASSEQPLGVPGLTDMTRLWAGADTTCAGHRDGHVVCWGENLEGQLPGAERGSVEPTRVELGEAPRVVAAGRRHLCALGAAGVVRCFGGNDAGQLGAEAPRTGGATTLTGLPPLSGLDVGDDHSYAWADDGQVFRWGAHISARYALLPPSRAAAKPGAHKGAPAARFEDATCLRRPDCSAEGRPDRAPYRESTLSVRAVAPGGNHACGFEADGQVVCWGGRVGRSHADDYDPARISGFDGAVEICSGNRFSCARGRDGRVRCAGVGSNVLTEHGTASAITCSEQRVCLLNEGGAVTCAQAGSWRRWPWDIRRGQLPDAPAFEDAIALAAGSDHLCALLEDGSVACLGDNLRGQLGVGRAPIRLVPTAVVAAREPAAAAIE